MKNKLSNLLLTILGGASLCIVAASCSNFMKAGDVRSEIEEAIEIANSNAVTYYVTADENSGTVTPTQFQLKKKQSFDLMYTPATGWNFICWEVLDRTTHQVITDSIDFKDPTKLETKATVKNVRENCVIHAKAVQQPIITAVSPGDSKISFANTPIVITFNKKMEDKNILSANSKFVYGSQNLTVLYGQTDISSYFQTPVFNGDKTELALYPKYDQFVEFIRSRTSRYLDITVSFGDAIDVDLSNNLMAVSDKAFIAAKYKPDTEEEPPVKNELFLTNKRITLNESANVLESDKFTQDDITCWSGPGCLEDSEQKKKTIQSRSNGTFTVYGKYTDVGSGVKTVRVKSYRLEQDASIYRYVIANENEEVFDFTKDSQDAVFYTEGNTTTFCLYVSVMTEKINEYRPNFRLVEVSVLDTCGNTTQKPESFYTCLKTEVEDCETFNPSNEDFVHGDHYLLYDEEDLEGLGCNCFYANEPEGYDDYYVLDTEYFNNNLKKLRIFTPYSPIPAWPDDNLYYYSHFVEGLGNNCLYPFELYTIKCEYKGRDNQIHTESFSKYDDVEKCWSLDLDVDSVDGLPFKIIVTDDLGNTLEKDFSYPGEWPIKEIKDNNNGTSTIQFQKDVTEFVMAFEDSQSGYTNVVFPDYNNPARDKITIQNGVNYTLIPLNNQYYPDAFDGGGTFMFGKIDRVYNTDTLRVVGVDKPVLASTPYTIEKGALNYYMGGGVGGGSGDNCHYVYYGNSGSMDITVYIQNGNVYDKLYLVYNNRYYYSEDKATIHFSVPYETMLSKTTDFTVYGVKGIGISEGLVKSIPKISATDSTLDNAPPMLFFECYNQGFDYYLFTLNDDLSGPKRIDVYVDGTFTYSFNSSTCLSGSSTSSYFNSSNVLLSTLSDEQINNLKTKGLLKDTTLYFLLPRSDLYGRNIEFKYWDNQALMGYSELKFYPEQKGYFYPVKGSLSDTSLTMTTEEMNEIRWWNKKRTFTIFTYDTINNNWVRSSSNQYTVNVTDCENGKKIYSTDISVPANKFVRIHSRANMSLSETQTNPYYHQYNYTYDSPQYFYTGSRTNSGTKDFFKKNGYSEEAMLVQSDAPVYVHTIAINKKLDTVQDWTEYEWELYGRSLGNQLYDFELTAPEVYTIPLDQINRGEYYIMIAWFADGSHIMTPIRQKTY